MAHPQKRKDVKTVRDFVPSDVIVQHLQTTDKAEAIGELLNALVIAGVLPLDKEKMVLEAILERERVASTGIGNGLAMPHGKSKFAERFGVAVGLSEPGIEFGAHDDIPAFIVVLWVCGPKDTKRHLALMRGLATVAKDPNLSGTLAGCRDKKSFLDVLEKVPIEERGK